MADNILNLADFDKVYPDSVDPVLSQAFEKETRIPNTHTVDENGDELTPALHASKLVTIPLSGATSLLGHRITHPIVDSPLVDLEEAFTRLRMAAQAAGDSPLADTSAAQDAKDILLGRTKGRYYDGFALLNYNAAPELPNGQLTPDHTPNEYKMKPLTRTGRKQVSPIDGVNREIWQVTINMLWYNQNFDSDCFLLRYPEDAHPNDTFEIKWRIYSLIQEDLAPTTIVNDAAGRIFHGFDSTFLSMFQGHLNEITVSYPSLRNMRRLYNWGWGVHPPRIQFIQPVFRKVRDDDGNPEGVVCENNGKCIVLEDPDKNPESLTCELNSEGQQVGWEPISYSWVKRLRDLKLEDIGDAAPEKKAYTVAQAALDGATGTDLLIMLHDPGTGSPEILRSWVNLARDQNQLPDEAWNRIKDEPDVDPISGAIGPYDVVVVYMNNEMYGITAAGTSVGGLKTIKDFEQGDIVKVKVINLDNHTHYYRNVDFGARFVKAIAEVYGNGKFSFEKFDSKPTYGIPKVAEMQWRTGWGYVPHRGVLQHSTLFSRNIDRSRLSPFTDQFGQTKYGYQFAAPTVNSYFRFNPPEKIRAGHGHPMSSQPGPDPISEIKHTDFGPGEPLMDDGAEGVKVGRDTEGFGVAKMPQEGPFCHPNPKTRQKLREEVEEYPGFLQNDCDAAGGDIIPPTPDWGPFLVLHPETGCLEDPAGGFWVDKTYFHGRPVPANCSIDVNVELPRATAQLFYQFDPLFHDNAIFSFHPQTDAARS